MESTLNVKFIIENRLIDTLNTEYFPCWGCYMYKISFMSYKHSGHIVFSNIIKTDSGIQLNGYKYTTNKTPESIEVGLPSDAEINATICLIPNIHIFNTILQDIGSFYNSKNYSKIIKGHNVYETMSVASLKEILNETQTTTQPTIKNFLPRWACYKKNGEYSGLFVLVEIMLNSLFISDGYVGIRGSFYTAQGIFGIGNDVESENGGFVQALGDEDDLIIFKDASEFAETLKELKEELTSASASSKGLPKGLHKLRL